jgi:hypothetical protein
MFLVLDWENAGYPLRHRHEVLRIAAELRRDHGLTGCLAALPADRLERGWLLAMLGALKRGGGIRAAATITGPIVSAESLAACHNAELDEAIIVQQDIDGTRAIEAVRSHQRAFPSSGMTVRVWLGDGGGSFQRQVAQWLHAGATLSSVEQMPFPSCAAGNAAPAAADGPGPLACQWVRSTLNLTGGGALHPCPRHAVTRDAAAGSRSVRDLIAQREKWLQTLGTHPICRGCDHLVRFAGPQQMLEAGFSWGPGPEPGPAGSFVDHVGGDANALAPEALERSLAAFAVRLRPGANGRAS